MELLNVGYSPSIKTDFSDISGISLILAASLSAIVDYPTFFRHSRSKKDSIIALFVIFVFTSLIQLSGICLFKNFGASFSGIISIFSDSYLLHGVMILFLIFSMITSTAWNAYAASVGWESSFPIYKDRTEYAVICLLAVVFSGAPLIAHEIMISMAILGIIISALGGVLVFQFLNKNGVFLIRTLPRAGSSIIWNSRSWAVASLIGGLVYFHVLDFSLFDLKPDVTLVSLAVGFSISLLTDLSRQVCKQLVNK